MAITAFAKNSARGNPDVMTNDEVNSVIEKASDQSTLAYDKKNPKRVGSAAAIRYSAYCNSKTIAEFAVNGGTIGDLKYDLRKGFVTIKS